MSKIDRDNTVLTCIARHEPVASMEIATFTGMRPAFVQGALTRLMIGGFIVVEKLDGRYKWWIREHPSDANDPAPSEPTAVR